MANLGVVKEYHCRICGAPVMAKSAYVYCPPCREKRKQEHKRAENKRQNAERAVKLAALKGAHDVVEKRGRKPQTGTNGHGREAEHIMRLTDEQIAANIEKVYQKALAAGTVGIVKDKRRLELSAEKVG